MLRPLPSVSGSHEYSKSETNKTTKTDRDLNKQTIEKKLTLANIGVQFFDVFGTQLPDFSHIYSGTGFSISIYFFETFLVGRM